MREIYDTEKSYVASLELLVKVGAPLFKPICSTRLIPTFIFPFFIIKTINYRSKYSITSSPCDSRTSCPSPRWPSFLATSSTFSSSTGTAAFALRRLSLLASSHHDTPFRTPRRELLETLEKRIATWNEDSVLGDAMNKLARLLLRLFSHCSRSSTRHRICVLTRPLVRSAVFRFHGCACTASTAPTSTT